MIGVLDEETGLVILKPNISKALEMLDIGVAADYPVANHLMGEVIHFRYEEIPQFYLEKYNLTDPTKRCEVSFQFYAKSVLRGYLKTWITLAEKRYLLGDFDGAY